MAGDRAVTLPFPPSPPPPHPRSPSFVATRRKSLRLTGSHGITGTRDIYASAPTDRSITRNKEIANLLQESSTTALRFLGALSAHYRLPPLPPPITLHASSSSSSILSTVESKGVRVRELFRLLWVEIAMGHPATFQMTGKKAATRAGVARENERN